MLQYSPVQLSRQPSSWEAALLKMACSLCSCGASHRCFSAASVQEPCRGGGVKDTVRKLRQGRLQLFTRSTTPLWKPSALARGSKFLGQVRWRKCCWLVLGENWQGDLVPLLVSLKPLIQRRHSFPSAHRFWLHDALWSLHRLRGRQMGKGSPAALPVSACVNPVAPSRMLPPWQTWLAGCAWGLRLLCKRVAQLAG